MTTSNDKPCQPPKQDDRLMGWTFSGSIPEHWLDGTRAAESSPSDRKN